jgi:glycerol 3-phosphatase-2
MHWLIDMDGVLWRWEAPIEGSAEAIRLLRTHGEGVAFVTNNSSLTRSEYQAKLARHGIDAELEEIYTSAQAAAGVLAPGERVLGIGERGLLEELERVGTNLVEVRSFEEAASVERVVLGWFRQFSYREMSYACVAIRAGAGFVATNADPTYPMEKVVVPGTGALVASIVAATGVQPIVAGKPEDAMVELVRPLVAGGARMIGDRLSTDGLFAKRLGVEFGLVGSGVQEEEDPDIPVARRGDRLIDIVREVLG